MPSLPTCKIPVGMLAALQEAGLSERQILMTAGLPSRLFDDPARRVPAPDYLRLWHAVRAVSGDPNIGITLARLLRPELTEPLVLAIVSAASVADAVEVMSTYKRLLCAEDIDVRTDAETGQLTLTYRWPPLEVAMPQVLVDTELAFIVETCRRATGCPGLTPQEIRLRARALEAGAHHADFFRCPLQLGCAENSIVFAAADAVRPFVTFNPQMLGALLPHLRATAPVVAKSPVEQARSAIAERLQGPRPTVHGVARQLTMSARALQRILKGQRYIVPSTARRGPQRPRPRLPALDVVHRRRSRVSNWLRGPQLVLPGVPYLERNVTATVPAQHHPATGRQRPTSLETSSECVDR